MTSSQLIGKVYLVGAGPGDVGLLTVRAKTLLEWADVVLYDALISPAILNLINPEAEKIHVGKRRGNHTLSQGEICRLLIDLAQRHAVIVRLKGVIPLSLAEGVKSVLPLSRLALLSKWCRGSPVGWLHLPMRTFPSPIGILVLRWFLSRAMRLLVAINRV